MTMTKQSSSRSSKSTGDPQAKIKLIAVAVVLLLAVGWIGYYMMPKGRPSKPTGKTAEVLQQEHEKTAAEVKQQQEKALPQGVKPPTPSGS